MVWPCEVITERFTTIFPKEDSEILVLADETANPRYVAADLLSQAEHDEMASAILVTTSSELAEKVSEEVDGSHAGLICSN